MWICASCPQLGHIWQIIFSDFPRWSMTSYSLWKKAQRNFRLRPTFLAVSCPAFLQRSGLIHPRCKKLDWATQKSFLCRTSRTIDTFQKYRDGKRNSYYNTIFFLKDCCVQKWGIRDYVAWVSHTRCLHWREKLHTHAHLTLFTFRGQMGGHNCHSKRGSNGSSW